MCRVLLSNPVGFGYALFLGVLIKSLDPNKLTGGLGRVMKNVILAICITSLIALSAPTSSACFCAMPDVPKAYEQATAVFVGKVVEIVPPRTSDENRPLADRFYTLKFKVEKSWKGSFPSLEISVLSGQGDGCLSYPVVKVGEKYLVYADPVLNDGVPVDGQPAIELP